MFCGNCGEKIALNSNFCGECGAIADKPKECPKGTDASDIDTIIKRQSGSNLFGWGVFLAVITCIVLLLATIGITGPTFFVYIAALLATVIGSYRFYMAARDQDRR